MRRYARQDPSVTGQKLRPGTVRRIMSYARPYRWQLAVFLVATCLDAVVVRTVVDPLLLRQIIDKGILPHRGGNVIGLAIVVAGVSFDALLAVAIRWFSARLTQSLTYDLRTQVFRHVSRQPIAFFIRARRVRWCPG